MREILHLIFFIFPKCCVSTSIAPIVSEINPNQIKIQYNLHWLAAREKGINSVRLIAIRLTIKHLRRSMRNEFELMIFYFWNIRTYFGHIQKNRILIYRKEESRNKRKNKIKCSHVYWIRSAIWQCRAFYFSVTNMYKIRE